MVIETPFGNQGKAKVQQNNDVQSNLQNHALENEEEVLPPPQGPHNQKIAEQIWIAAL